MKKITFLILSLFLCSSTLFSQNFFSPKWKISFNDTTIELQNSNKVDRWEDVNLLLSWERQGYYAHSGKGCLAKVFIVPESYRDTDLILSLCLQFNVESIYINNKYIGGNLPNQFWSDQREAQTVFSIPKEILTSDGHNIISIFASDFSYTGGKSYNTCSLSPVKTNNSSELIISVPARDHIFSVDDKSASIDLEYKACQKGSIELFIVSDFHDTLVHKTFRVDAGEGTIPFNFTKAIDQPGFYECTAVMEDIGFSGAVRWFSISPEKLECSQQTVPRFDEYWEAALLELKEVAPEFKVRKIDSLSTGSRDGYVAEMKSLGGLTIRGFYFIPRAEGKHRAVLHLPGYGYGFNDVAPFINSNDSIIELAICVRGHGISTDVFKPVFDIPGIWGYKLCSEKENIYRSIYMDCVRAVEFLMSRPEVDTTKIAVMGGSQGGGLALATAGLCHGKVNACAFFDPFLADTRHQLKIRTMCNEQFKSYLEYYNNECTFEDALRIQDLIDTKWFADRITCPVFFTAALFDDDCPPHMGFAAYNRIKSPKQFKVNPDDSHLDESGSSRAMMKFLLSQ